ncbi:MAG TPA: TIGR00282 family metallophosphoesterase [Thermodesulfobacteriota bacterium]|nr:TIGR00282 family metallophosphoesterase [Thermodesulfobacteriota bacterium]
MEKKEGLCVLFIGDIVGEPGRNAVKTLLPGLVKDNLVDFVVANCENAAAGKGITPKITEYLLNTGINVLTSGNHIWDRQEIIPYIETQPLLLRPANYPKGTPGKGHGIFETKTGYRIGVVNLCGKLFMDSYEHPFLTALDLVNELSKHTRMIIVDFHAEATSEKKAMGWYLDGKVSAIIGTHTHVQTADERVLPKGSSYITDVGMTGSIDSVIGMDKEKAIKRFLTLIPIRLEPATDNVCLNGVLVDLDKDSGKSLGIKRIVVNAK